MLSRRNDEHKLGTVPGFTQRYKVNRLVYMRTVRINSWMHATASARSNGGIAIGNSS